MTKEEQRIIKRLERNLIVERRWAIFFIAAIFIFIVFAVIDATEIKKLEQELQSCQEKVDVWVWKVECRDYLGIDKVIFEKNFTSYGEYSDFKLYNFAKANCEVIK